MRTTLIIILVIFVAIITFASGVYYGKTMERAKKETTASQTTQTATATQTASSSKTTTATATATALTNENVRVTNPASGQKITSPLTVTGEAKGTWYGEGEFPVVLQDGNGAEIARANATAQGEWMTESFVPFSATLEFTAPMSPVGTLILKNADASGNNPQEVKIPVKF